MDNLVLFFDGCHKIYYADRSDTATINQMEGWGYSVIDGDFRKNLHDLYENSCSLRFVEAADLDNAKPAIEQGNNDLDSVDWLIADLAKRYEVAA